MLEATKSRFMLLSVFMLFLVLPTISPASDDQINAVKEQVYAWQTALIDRDIDAHLAHYSTAYPFDIYPNSLWLGEKKLWAKDAKPFEMTIIEPEIRIENGTAVVDFVETFKRLPATAIGKKRLKLEKKHSRWLIVSEEWIRYIFEIRLSPQANRMDDGESRLRISIIEYDYEADQPEKVCVTLDRYAVPEVIALEGEKPRIALDFRDTSPVEKHRDIRAGGLLIKKIRTHHHADSAKLRVVLDLNPLEDFHVDPVFYKAENRYCLIVNRNAVLQPNDAE